MREVREECDIHDLQAGEMTSVDSPIERVLVIIDHIDIS